ncbi:glycine cleavage system H-protein subunit [Microbotryomycetes sp. JL221]|nr:glycine cleavage system H-protein subunit [Microbotryomycetes sp. JL221]
MFALRTAPLRTVVTQARCVKPVMRPMLVRTVVTKRFTTDHEWISFDSDSSVGTIGITEYAQKSLGDVVYVELPAQHTTIAQGEQIGAVESVKAASDIFAPVSGEVSEVNEALSDSPDLLNKSAEQDGWLAKIKLSNPSEFEQLLSQEAYQAHCEGGEH